MYIWWEGQSNTTYRCVKLNEHLIPGSAEDSSATSTTQINPAIPYPTCKLILLFARQQLLVCRRYHGLIGNALILDGSWLLFWSQRPALGKRLLLLLFPLFPLFISLFLVRERLTG